MSAKEKKVIRLALKWYTSSGFEGRQELWYAIAELYGDKAVEQSMHPTIGILRDLLARFWLRVLSAIKHFTSPPTSK